MYNGAATVPALVGALSRLPVPGGIEIVLVNDGSADDSARICAGLVATASVPVVFVDLMRNFGEHNAVMAGLHRSAGRWVITMDDDRQNPPEEALRLLRFAQAENADVVYTSFTRKAHSAWRNLGSAFANKVADILLDKPKGLYLSSFRCISRRVVDAILPYDGPFPYVDGLILQTTQSIRQLEVIHQPRATGSSNYTFWRLVRLWLSIVTNFSIVPLRLATFLGLTMSGLGFMAILWLAARWAITGGGWGWGSLMAGLTLFAGVQLFVTGLLGEYLGRLFLTANRKPQFLIRSVLRSKTEDAAPPSPHPDNQPPPPRS